LFPSCDVAIFPSVVAEAGPLVFLEAMASGCFPMGAYHAGMAASIDSVAGSIPDHVLELMRLRVDEKYIVADIVANVQRALNIDEDSKAALRKIAVEKYDWQTVSKRLADNLVQGDVER
jgi:glycosyltransferase involved in cell wall biosynthesis